MARKYAGGVSTDKISFGSIIPTTLMSVSMLVNLVGVDTVARRGHDGNNLGTTQFTSNNGFIFTRRWSVTDGSWITGAGVTPATGTWANIVVVYDGGSTLNNPSVYFDNSLQSITVSSVPVGSVLNTITDNFDWGNRIDNARALNGSLAEVAIWNRLLSSGEIAALAKRFSPLYFPNGLYFYSSFIGRNSPEIDLKGKTGSVSGAINEVHPRIILPSTEQIRRFGSGLAPATLRTLPLLGAGR